MNGLDFDAPQPESASLALMMAHDLRNLLTVLTNLTLLMEHHYEQRHLDLMKKHLELCDLLVGNFLHYSSGRPARRERIRLDEFLGELPGAMILPANVELKITGHPDIHVWIDPVQFRQVVLNLLLNSAEALDGEEGKIRIHVSESADTVRVDVSDTGPGIPSALIPDLFGSFASTKKTGLGLGLALCKKLVEGNGGKLEFQSGTGAGTQFSITLPKTEK